ncbi:MAG: hypothetical protein V2I43_28985, partial [Parvularcula sp.]|nr:hypothetical protein [Parvularcula sp.]
ENLFDDSASRLENAPQEVQRRVVYRHEAEISGLTPGSERTYRIMSVDENGGVHYAGPFTLEPAPRAGEPIEILLTSDMQERYNVLPNYEKVAELFPDLEAIFFAGDIVNVPYRAASWFDANRDQWADNIASGNFNAVNNVPFFPSMQGRFDELQPTSPSAGGELLQHVPLYPSIGNHEVNGRFRPNQEIVVNGAARTVDLNYMDNDPQPRWYAAWRYEQNKNSINPSGDASVRERWIAENSNDFASYRDLWTLPDENNESYYVKIIGDVALISMNASRIWRTWNVNANDRGKFTETAADANNPGEWGFGDHIFEPFHRGSEQYDWLAEVLQRADVQAAKYRVVMAHQTMFGVGDNAVPVQTNPQMEIVYRDQNGIEQFKAVPMPDSDEGQAETFASEVQPLIDANAIISVRYEYPLTEDYWLTDIEPLLEANNVDLVHTGHSHVWNRAKSASGKLDYIETSNVGNCFGAFWTNDAGQSVSSNNGGRVSWASSFWNAIDDPNDNRWDGENYARFGDPHGREIIFPNISNAQADYVGGEAVPYLCSNAEVSVFTILDTGMGAVRSFAFDPRPAAGEPSPVVEFDRLMLD